MASGPINVGTIHPALNRVLDVFPADTAARAAAALQTLLRERVSAGGARAWSSSRLNGDGFPVEIAFTTADDRLRYTLEPAGCDISPQQRLEAAIQLINALSPAALPADVADTFRSIQQFDGLAFGAWIGGRHSSADSQYKIYVEMPDRDAEDASLSALLSDRLGEYPAPRLFDRFASPRMVAFTPAVDLWEFYYRVKSLAPHHVPGVLAPVGLAAQAQELLGYIQDAYGYALRERLPGESVGISYTARGRLSEAQSVTLFLCARALLSDDARIRQQFGRLSQAFGWDDSRYQQITVPLAARRTWKTYHGIMGITLTRAGQMALSMGLSPRDPSAVGE